MAHRISVERLTEDSLSGEIWVFSYFEDRQALILVGYDRVVRSSKRHKFKSTAGYFYLGRSRGVDYGGSKPLSIEQISIPSDVANEALAKLVASTTVRTWGNPNWGEG